MIKEFLLNLRQELIAQRIDLQRELDKNEISIRENMEFVRMIEESEDKSYESFTPMNYTNNRNSEKTKELKNMQVQVKEKSTYILEQIQVINTKIDELEQVLQQVKKDESTEYQLQRKQESIEKIYSSAVQQLTSIIHKIETCGKLVNVDANRCKLELVTVTTLVKGVIDELKKCDL